MTAAREWGSRRPVVGVMGAGAAASPAELADAEALGEKIARQGWTLLTGGRPAGVMDAAARGAKKVPGSLVVGVLPGEAGPVSAHVDVAIFTGMGHARNAINVLSSDVVVACGVSGAGTASEVALAIKSRRPVVLLAPTAEAAAFYRSLSPDVAVAATAEEAIDRVAERLAPDR